MEWSADGAALVWTRWYQTRTTSIMFVEPAGESRLYMEYDYSDGYTHPGSPLSEPGPWGRSVLRRHDGGGLLWAGGGESADGARPFLDERSYSDGKFVRRLWRGAVGCYDSLSAVLPAEASAAVAPEAVASGVEVILLTRRQTQTVPPQMLLRAVSAESAAAASADALSDEARADSSTILATLSSPDHPQPSLKGISKTLIRYKRADGVDLSGTLYTPAGYDAATDGPLPTILWAYPREFKSKGSAGQVRGSEHTFTMIRWASPLFWLTRGYAVLDGFAMPIIGAPASPTLPQYLCEPLRLGRCPPCTHMPYKHMHMHMPPEHAHAQRIHVTCVDTLVIVGVASQVRVSKTRMITSSSSFK